MQPRKLELKFFYALSFAFQLGFIIAAPIVGFILLGFWADKHFSTFPLMLILGVVVGIVITFYEVYRFIEPLIEK